MDTTRVLVFLFVVSSFWCSNARDLSINRVNGKSEFVTEGEVQLVKDQRLCSLCEEFAGQAFNYLSENKTQTEIIDTLHKSCSKIPSFKQQCIVLVDYYAPLFFLEVSSVEADEFCRKVDLCEERVSSSHRLSQDKCGICQNVVTEALLKLKDPDTELEIIQLLLKACNSAGNNVKKCKRLVFEYAPILLVNAEEFLEKTTSAPYCVHVMIHHHPCMLHLRSDTKPVLHSMKCEHRVIAVHMMTNQEKVPNRVIQKIKTLPCCKSYILLSLRQWVSYV